MKNYINKCKLQKDKSKNLKFNNKAIKNRTKHIKEQS